jgi:hypothetical protein
LFLARPAPDVSLFDSSFAVAAIGDKTYDDLEVAEATSRERRRSMGRGVLRRPMKSSFSSATSAKSDGSSARPTTPPPVPLTMRRSPPASLVEKPQEQEQMSESVESVSVEPADHEREELEQEEKASAPVPAPQATPLRPQPSVALLDKSRLHLKQSTIFTNANVSEALLDADDFELTPPDVVPDALTHALAHQTPLRAQTSVSLFDRQAALHKSTIFTHGADPEKLLDSESFQLTPPSSARTPARSERIERIDWAERTPLAQRGMRTPHSLLASRHAPRVPVEETPTKADTTLDLGALIRTARPKRMGTTAPEESFLAPTNTGMVTLADLSAEDAQEDLSAVLEEDVMIPDELRPRARHAPPSASASAASSVSGTSRASTASAASASSHLGAHGLPLLGPAPTAMPPPRSHSTRRLSSFPRSASALTLDETKRKRLVPSASTAALSTLATPRRTANASASVPLTMRRNPPASATRPSVAPAPAERDRWADAVERNPAPIAATPAAAERRLPAAASSRRLSTLATATATGVARSKSVRGLGTLAERTTGATGITRSGSLRAIGVGARAPSRESDPAVPTVTARTTTTRASAPPATAAAARTPAPRTSLAPRPRQSLAPAPAPKATTAAAPARAGTSLARRTAPRTSLAPAPAVPPAARTATTTTAATRRTSLAPTSATTATPATRRTSLAPTAAPTARISSRPSLAPTRARPLGDAAPVANRPAATTVRPKPVPTATAAERRHMSTPASTATAAATRLTATTAATRARASGSALLSIAERRAAAAASAAAARR